MSSTGSIRGPDRAAIAELSGPKVFARAEDIVRHGLVSAPRLEGKRLRADVQGSEDEPYAVSAALAGGRVESASCTCPYDFGGLCKHIAAVLLIFAATPGRFTAIAPLADRLAALDRDSLEKLVLGRAKVDTGFARWLEGKLAKPKPAAKGPQKPARGHLSGPCRAGWSYWDHFQAAGDLDELKELAGEAAVHLEAGDGRAALEILEAVTEELLESRSPEEDEEGELFALAEDLGVMIAEAVIMADFDEEERAALAEMVEGFIDELADYGDTAGFDVALAALAVDFNAPDFTAILAGAPTGGDPPLDHAMRHLVLRRLDALGKADAYLNFAKATGERDAYAAMLVTSGRMDEALSFGLTTRMTAGEALSLARNFDAAGAGREALLVAKAGFDRAVDEPGRAALAAWLRDKAAAGGDPALAIRAAEACFAETLALADFAAAKSIAGPLWGDLRLRLLARLAAGKGARRDRPAIYLGEGMAGEAIATVFTDRGRWASDDVLLALAAAARRSHPGWVIETALGFANAIMNEGRANDYALAAQWLAEAARAYEDDGRDEDWRQLLERLILTHKRKHKLRAELEALR